MPDSQAGSDPVLVTGAAGYLGQALVAALRAQGRAVIATDLALPAPPAPPGRAEPEGSGEAAVGDRRRVPAAVPGASFAAGDLTDPRWQDALFEHRPATVFHLAGIVSGAAEADFERGRRVNLDATLQLLERCRQQAAAGGPPVTLVYTSSIAVFGVPLPVCPVGEDATVWLSSLRHVVGNLLRMAARLRVRPRPRARADHRRIAGRADRRTSGRPARGRRPASMNGSGQPAQHGDRGVRRLRHPRTSRPSRSSHDLR